MEREASVLVGGEDLTESPMWVGLWMGRGISPSPRQQPHAGCSDTSWKTGKDAIIRARHNNTYLLYTASATHNYPTTEPALHYRTYPQVFLQYVAMKDICSYATYTLLSLSASASPAIR